MIDLCKILLNENIFNVNNKYNSILVIVKAKE